MLVYLSIDRILKIGGLGLIIIPSHNTDEDFPKAYSYPILFCKTTSVNQSQFQQVASTWRNLLEIPALFINRIRKTFSYYRYYTFCLSFDFVYIRYLWNFRYVAL